jgi:prolyl-tRNA synthetase
MSTRMIGGLIMTHGDDDGLRAPPRIAPWQVVIVPMLRDTDEDAAVLDYCRALVAELQGQSALGEPVRALLDAKAVKAANKRWAWVKKGAPLIVEVGPRDMAGGNVSWIRRDRLYQDNGKLASTIQPRAEFVAGVPALLAEIQAGLFAEAKGRLEANIRRGVTDFAELERFFETSGQFPGWVEVEWSRPTGAELDAVDARLKALKLTLRNVPEGAAAATGACIFTGKPAVERVLVGRSY